MAHKLLLADDSVTIQKVIELTFADEDITVIAVGDGRQAIQQAVAERPDIVLADVGMPEHDGYEVAAFIKNTPDLAHIPVLLLTGAFEPIDEGRARAARCDGVLVKPFEPQMVINRVKDLIAGRPPVQAVSHGSPPAPFGRPVHQQGSVEDYFDHLDAAFAAKESPGMAPQGPRPDEETPSMAGLAEELANWTPDLPPPAAPSPAPEPAPASAEASAFARASTSAKASVDKPADQTAGELSAPGPAPAFAEASAFAKPSTAAKASVDKPADQTAGKRSAPVLPSLADAFATLLAAEQGHPHAPSSINRDALADDVVEQVTRRVLERIGDGVVREVVLDVAERLVREEIARIKAKTP